MNVNIVSNGKVTLEYLEEKRNAGAAATSIQRVWRNYIAARNERVATQLKNIFCDFNSSENGEEKDTTIFIKLGRATKEFPLRIRKTEKLGFLFSIPALDNPDDVNYLLTGGILLNLYPNRSLKKCYGLRGDDLMKLTDAIAKAFQFSQVSLTDASHYVLRGDAKMASEEITRFANRHNLSMEKSNGKYINPIINKYHKALSIGVDFCLRIIRPLIKGNSWYGKYGYYPKDLTSDQYLMRVKELRSIDLKKSMDTNGSFEGNSFVRMMYQEFSEVIENREHSVGNFFEWLSTNRPYSLEIVYNDISRGSNEICTAKSKIGQMALIKKMT
ncbi:MAG: hypothetical protein AAGG81_06020 [Chlamydiota bacterium]